jgi:ATP-dependent DNA helicase RecQ
VSYYQQIGRAGRGIEHALVVLLSSSADEGVWDYFATATIPDAEQVGLLLAGMGPQSSVEVWTVPVLEAETGLRRGRVELMLKQLAVDGVVERVERGWRRTSLVWRYDAEHYDSVIATRRREAEIMRRYLRGASCLMQLLQESLDDPSARPCGRCSVCRGALPTGLPHRPPASAVATVAALLRGETHVVAPRKMWPGGDFGSRGRIPATLLPEPGRSLIYAEAPEWADEIAAFGTGAGPSGTLLATSVAVMTRWRSEWVTRPEVVISLPAAGLDVLADEVADHFASVGRLKRATIALPASPDDPRSLGSAAEAAYWRDGLRLDEDAQRSVLGRSVLLVVDATSSLWPITMAAALLRESGAVAVLPFLVHQLP